jgi:hypothetical protein
MELDSRRPLSYSRQRERVRERRYDLLQICVHYERSIDRIAFSQHPQFCFVNFWCHHRGRLLVPNRRLWSFVPRGATPIQHNTLNYQSKPNTYTEGPIVEHNERDLYRIGKPVRNNGQFVSRETPQIYSFASFGAQTMKISCRSRNSEMSLVSKDYRIGRFLSRPRQPYHLAPWFSSEMGFSK